MVTKAYIFSVFLFLFLTLVQRPTQSIPDGAMEKQIVNTMISKENNIDNRRSMYQLSTKKWPTSQPNLTYQILSETLVPGAENMHSIVAEAFSKWAKHCPFTFHEVPEGTNTTNFVFGFYKGDHGDGRPFYGPGGATAHSFYPTDGRSHYDATENWSDDPGKDQIDLPSVVLHEMGHLLGLNHSSVYAVMKPVLARGEKLRELQEDDIKGIEALYSYTSSSATKVVGVLSMVHVSFLVYMLFM